MAEGTVSQFEARIAPELQELVRPVEEATPHPDNSRKHDLPSIARSLQRHGQRSPIVVQTSTGYIVKGNGTWIAATQILGWKELAQSWQDLSDEEALPYLLADNKASDGATYDPRKLRASLEKMVEGPGLLDTLWSNEELEDLIEADEGPMVMDPQETGAAHADPELKGKIEARKGESVRMKEASILLTIQDHALFVGWIKTLRQKYGTTGSVATIFEAVKRQAESEEGAARLGRDVSAEELARIKRELVVEIRAVIASTPDARFNRAYVYGVLEAAAPQPTVSPLRPDVVEGQLEAFPDLVKPAPESEAEALPASGGAEEAGPEPDPAPVDEDELLRRARRQFALPPAPEEAFADEGRFGEAGPQ
jgi:hypothetical protein